MTSPLSTRAFKFLQRISRKSGLQYTNEDIHDMGTRLLGLCHVAARIKNREDGSLQVLLTEIEIKTLRILREQFAATGRISSARELSQALGYRSSRSGHML